MQLRASHTTKIKTQLFWHVGAHPPPQMPLIHLSVSKLFSNALASPSSYPSESVNDFLLERTLSSFHTFKFHTFKLSIFTWFSPSLGGENTFKLSHFQISSFETFNLHLIFPFIGWREHFQTFTLSNFKLWNFQSSPDFPLHWVERSWQTCATDGHSPADDNCEDYFAHFNPT